MKVRVALVSKIASLFAVCLILVAGLMFRDISEIQNNYQNSKKEIDSQISELLVLNNLLGYGGLIHQFKNYVLRGDEIYRDEFLQKYTKSKLILERLKISIKEESSLIDIENILGTIEQYYSNLSKIDRIKNKIKEIDLIVKVDDSKAIASMDRLLNHYFAQRNASAVSFEEKLYWFKKMLFMVILLLFIAFFVTLSILVEKINQSNKIIHKEQIKNASNVIVSTMSEVSGSLHHEILNPLQIVSSYNQYLNKLALKSSLTTEEVVKSSQKIATAIDRIHGIIRGVAGFTNNENTDLELNDFNLIVEDAIFVSRHRSISRNITFTNNKPAQTIWVECVGSELSIIIMSIFNHFFERLKGSDDVKTVRIDYSFEGEKVIVSIHSDSYTTNIEKEEFQFIHDLVIKNNGKLKFDNQKATIMLKFDYQDLKTGES